MHALRFSINADTVSHLECVDLKHRNVKVRAQKYIVAVGGIESARLLLVSGVGKNLPKLGMCYMDHPKMSGGILATYDDVAIDLLHRESAKMILGYRIRDSVQRDRELFNSHVTFEPLRRTNMLNRLAPSVFRSQYSKTRFFTVRSYFEQLPTASSFVSLSDQYDRYGIPRARVHWRLSDRDLSACAATHRVLREEFHYSGVGDFSSELTCSSKPPQLQDASHHMGATRMGFGVKDSVVDKNLRVHYLDNMYVAGSSVFPVGGYANPVATIAALSIRLADHIKDQI